MIKFVAIFVFIYSAHACEHSRESGLFDHSFTSNSATNNFIDDTETDSSTAYGDSKVVTFTDSKIKIYSDTEHSTVRVYDNGLLLFKGSTKTEYDGTDVFNIKNQAFAAPLWFEDDSGKSVEYKYTFKHLKASAMVDTGNQAFGQSRCDMQRIKNLIGDCKANGYRDSLSDVVEALIVTWQIEEGGDIYYFQGVVAVNKAGETHVIFLYNDPADIPGKVTGYSTGYITADSATSPSPNAGVCPHTADKVGGGSKLHEKSNCRCGEHTKGIYSFKTSTASDACGKTKANFDLECKKDITTDDTTNFKMSCRPERNPQDTCLEQVYCRKTDSGYEVNINLLYAPHGKDTAVGFMETLTKPNTNAACVKLVQEISPGSGQYKVSITIADNNKNLCDWKFAGTTPEEISFITRVYNTNEKEIHQTGDIHLMATCDVLPNEATVNIKKDGVAIYDVPAASSRYVKLFVSSSRYYATKVPSIIPDGATVKLGQDIYLGLGYDHGTTAPIDKVHAYGLYPYDCKVSNNKDFIDDANTNRVTQLTDAKGCRSSTLLANKAFYLEEEFKVSSVITGTTYGIIPDTVKGTYNFVQLSGKFDAAKWNIGASESDHTKVYFQCKVGFCRNQAFKEKSKCWDVCGNDPNVDYTIARRRRDVNETTEDTYPSVTLNTHITLKKSPPQAREEPKVECVSNVIAYSTMLALSMLLLVAMGVTLMMFVKLSSRQRKRV